MPSTTISMAASCVAQKLGIKGECLGISNACASGTNALGEAFRLIRYGHSPLFIAGGSEAPICRLCVEGYGISGALSKNAALPGNALDVPRPFDKRRDGFVLSEGASVLVLEEYEHAMKRDAKIYGEIVAYGNTTDSFHMTKPDPEGEARAIAEAMKEAGISPDEIDYINTHGTGTPIGDIAEARAIKMIFREGASVVPASALKSMTGHMLAASGAFEIACTLMSMKEGIIPPTINLDDKDPECDINVITGKKEAEINIAISNSFGFGGVNAVIVLRKV
jgi:3-oxoacyl-[acyl-carrier-protein] synthase II